MLTALLFLPLVAGLVILALPRGQRDTALGVALAASLATFALGVRLYAGFDFHLREFQYVNSFTWIPAFGAEYRVGLDGISLGLTLLTTFLTPIVLWYIRPRLGENANGLLFTILALETALIGILVSTDVLLFYVFWEAMLIPMYFLISIWGGERRSHASLKFIVYMMVGSLLMLVGILWFYWSYHTNAGLADGQYTFDYARWLTLNTNPATRIAHGPQMWMFFFFFISFAIKVPLFPFHTWLPDAQEEAPIAFNVLLIEVGAYAFVRFCLALFPDAAISWAPFMMSLAVINIIYGATMAIVQQDLKRLFSYSSMSHGGFMILGVFSMTMQGIEGALLYMVNSGLTAAGLFIIADLLYQRRGSRRIRSFGGLAPRMPYLYFMFMVVALAAIGLPPLNGFASEFLVMLGAIRAGILEPAVVSPVYGYLAGAGVVLSAVYMLWMFQRVMYGEPRAASDTPDLTAHEKATLWPLLVVIFLIGIWSSVVTRPMDARVKEVIAGIQNGVAGTTLPPPSVDFDPGPPTGMTSAPSPGGGVSMEQP